ncbi:sulfotransferase family 2 domain-containing protein [Sphingomonas radiodurans]|uniref:sulfotransferase family 2 domain-containing protein n=1 Tax=Sphingomonas radiodurans TaxID=2890321 RepID=UPI001E4A7E71|nr:sulfotransferase family 2 domain-containing protein [Sphingomonas radiodurans]WBH16072.1 sulfotransferase family 2 domain-containing protein [Sphingomonas radiodurans]
MAFGNITKGLAPFFANERFTEELCIFIHVPKTAGSSLSAELARMRRPYRNIHRQYFYGETVTFTRIEDEIAAVIDDGTIAAARSCSGHFTWDMAAPIRTARPDARAFTFLRDPIQRVISDYRYSRTPSHPTYAQTIARFPTIEHYIEAPETQNKMARFLMPNDVVTSDQINAFIGSNYAFVGLLENYALSFNILSRLLGTNLLPSEHKRATEDTEDNHVDVTPDLHAAIAKYNQRDVALYEIARANLATVAGEWSALMAAEPPPAARG